jgi:hypothetical protein
MLSNGSQLNGVIPDMIAGGTPDRPKQCLLPL